MRRWTSWIVVAACLAGGPAAAQGFGRHGRAEPAATRPASAEKVFPFDETWVLQSIDDKPLPTNDPPSFSIDRSLRARGFSGCNTFSMALYPVKNQTLAAGAIATTRKTCAPEAMALERTFLVAMHSLPKWDLRPDADLTVAAPHAKMRFRRGI